jgi:hypothetical protein
MASRTLLVLAGLFASATPLHAQPKKLTVAIYAPSVDFGSSTARVAYVQALAKAIEQNTGMQVDAQSYANLSAMKKDNVDFAIVDGPCYATNLGWKLLATAQIGGGTTRAYGLFANDAKDMQSLKGKKLAFIASGCNDTGFVDNAMLDSEVDASFFGARIGKPDVASALAEVAQTKTAQAVFAPIGSAKGLTKLFDTGAVPNPAFVDVGSKLPAATVDKVAAAVTGFGGGGAIAGWSRPTREIYTSFAGRLGRVAKTPVFATPEPARIDSKDVLIEPASIKDYALVGVRHHFVRAPGERME